MLKLVWYTVVSIGGQELLAVVVVVDFVCEGCVRLRVVAVGCSASLLRRRAL